MSKKLEELFNRLKIDNETRHALLNDEDGVDPTEIVDKFQDEFWKTAVADPERGGKLLLTERAHVTGKHASLLRSKVDLPDDPALQGKPFEELIEASLAHHKKRLEELYKERSTGEANAELRKQVEAYEELRRTFENYKNTDVPRLIEQERERAQDVRLEYKLRDIVEQFPTTIPKKTMRDVMLPAIYGRLKSKYDLREQDGDLIPFDKSSGQQALNMSTKQFENIRPLVQDILRDMQILNENASGETQVQPNTPDPAANGRQRAEVQTSEASNAPHAEAARRRRENLEAASRKIKN